MGNQRSGRHRSGNPARRAAEATRKQVTDLWPFAVDYFVQSSRLGLYRDVEVITVGGESHLDIPDVGQILIDPARLDDAATGDGRVAVGAAVIAHENAEWVAILCPSTEPDERTRELLDGISEAFVHELGIQGAATYARDAALHRPSLRDPTEAMSLIEALFAVSALDH